MLEKASDGAGQMVVRCQKGKRRPHRVGDGEVQIGHTVGAANGGQMVVKRLTRAVKRRSNDGPTVVKGKRRPHRDGDGEVQIGHTVGAARRNEQHLRLTMPFDHAV